MDMIIINLQVQEVLQFNGTFAKIEDGKVTEVVIVSNSVLDDGSETKTNNKEKI